MAKRVDRFLAVALIPAIAQLGLFAVVLGTRLGYPLDVEWLEGPQLYMAYRLAHGLPVFGPPSTGFIPCPYPPLYHAVVGAIGRSFGFDYWNGRLVSDLAIAVAVAVIVHVVRGAAPSRRTGAILGVMSAACVAASYRLLGASMDLARVDMFGVALVLLGAVVAQGRPLGWARAAALGVLACAAVYTKQSNVFFAAWLIAYVALRDRRGAIVATVAALAVGVPPLVMLQRATDGWFWKWMMIMRMHPYVPLKVAGAAAGVAVVFWALGRLAFAMHRNGSLREPTKFWCGMLAASVPACLVPTLTISGWINNMIGLVLVAQVCAWLFVCDWLVHASDVAMERGVILLVAGLLAGAVYDPSRYVPDDAQVRDAQALHAAVRSLDGDVLLPMYPFVAARDGKTTPQISLLTDWDTVYNAHMPIDMAAAVRAEHADWIVLLGHGQEDEVRRWVAAEYDARDLDIHVQALMQTSSHNAVLLERRAGGGS